LLFIQKVYIFGRMMECIAEVILNIPPYSAYHRAIVVAFYPSMFAWVGFGGCIKLPMASVILVLQQLSTRTIFESVT
jgi:hypothetical protein